MTSDKYREISKRTTKIEVRRIPAIADERLGDIIVIREYLDRLIIKRTVVLKSVNRKTPLATLPLYRTRGVLYVFTNEHRRSLTRTRKRPKPRVSRSTNRGLKR